MKQSFTDEAYRTFPEEVAGALDGKEGYILELGATGGVQLYTNSLKPIGIMHGKIQGGNDINVRLLGKGGTVKVIQGGAIAVNNRVMPANGGKAVIGAGAAQRCIGLKIQGQAAGADGEFMEIIDALEYVP
jgi:hypothetical protein